MQNKQISLKVFLASLLIGTAVFAQELEFEGAQDSLSDFSAGIGQKKTVDFPARSSLGAMELAPLPGIYETNVNGPQPMAESVSINDTPSEQLLGRLTPEVFQEMAELERDKAYLKLLTEKEDAKNDLERKRAQYRQDRLAEIKQREELIRERIQWWQEQEKLRQEMEKERQEAEELKAQLEEAEALQEGKGTVKEQPPEIEEEDLPPEDALDVSSYELVNVKGTRGNLIAQIRNISTDEISSVKVGDSLSGEIVTAITLDNVVIDHDGTEYLIKFSNKPKVNDG